VGWTGTLKDLGVGILVIALSPWLDGVDGVVSWSVVGLPSPKVVLLAPIMIFIAAVVVVVASVIAVAIMTLILLVGSRSLANVFLDQLVDLVSICPLLHHREQDLD
jgi:hypothetical protein